MIVRWKCSVRHGAIGHEKKDEANWELERTHMSKIVIAGAGYAGMMAAAYLDRQGIPFTLVNNHDYHYLTILLHEVAGGRDVGDKYKIPIKEVLRNDSSELVVTTVTGIDRERRVLKTTEGEIGYDYLIYALGWVSEYFGIKGLKEYSLSITNLDSAVEIRRHIDEQFRLYKQDGDERHLRIALGGAGLTGIELMGELLEYLPKLCRELDIPWEKVDVQCIEAMPTILPMVAEHLRPYVVETITKRGGKLRTNAKINEVTEGVIHLDGGEKVEAGTIVWTGGVRANPILSEAGFTVDRRGRAKVNAYLQSVDDEQIFVAGDSAWAEDENGRPYAPTAQNAEQMGPLAAKNILLRERRREMQPFKPRDWGTLCSLGSEVGVGSFLGVPIKGVMGALAKEGSKAKYLWELGGLRLAGNHAKEVVRI
ncbi:FAD-dependent pyridine nucleotide-disulfide oxidoreductase [Alicyclobacillus acidocaldarius subsp. acidocaldarius Tc-4-1]|uniref:FAD-dependent pyridine nucleotide-disulfide oxidoreductase n=2 Tax=Alicyclobacillus acidocaldarius TaxID=405212 RepID=F8IF66_ALIAT|nr:FAD-dependent pyridine nucleotide-disulfide oxidoreductase [Alicyclobacillus acidocaldarius subsp. acidocaldarius Tc-4-1]